ncbi:hypothetical protein [Isoptericola sp. 178]|uniref:hypothetical protein n=1 Tax=Isoptericola sp. 178 TaxID=3064651 RepID=UPI00271223C9|nr:hypothetical protein [Isoptericola sp. 178]MDO8143656.1 hypothetical protein [Isoptericola sp. 178]
MNAQDPLLAELREAVDHLEVPPGLDPDRMARRAVRRVRARRVVLAGGTGALALVLAVGGVQALPELVDRPLTGAVLPGGPGPSETVPRAADGAADRVRVWLGPVVVSLPADWEADGPVVRRDRFFEVTGRTGGIADLTVSVGATERSGYIFYSQNLGWTVDDPGATFPDVPGAGLTVMRVVAGSGDTLRAVLSVSTDVGAKYEVIIGDVPDTAAGRDVLQGVVDNLSVEREIRSSQSVHTLDAGAGLPAGWREIEAGRLRLGVPDDWQDVGPWTDDPGSVMAVSPDDDGFGVAPAVVAVRPTPPSAAWMVSAPPKQTMYLLEVDGARRVVVTPTSGSWWIWDTGDGASAEAYGRQVEVEAQDVRIDVELDDGEQYTVHLELPTGEDGQELLNGILGSLRVAD